MFDRKITLISNSRETLDRVHKYLERTGARLSTAARLEDALMAAATANAILFFADDYPRQDALAALASLRRTLPATLLIVVTDAVEMFTPSVRGDRTASHVIVLQRPAWAWMLVDALRAGSVNEGPRES